MQSLASHNLDGKKWSETNIFVLFLNDPNCIVSRNGNQWSFSSCEWRKKCSAIISNSKRVVIRDFCFPSTSTDFFDVLAVLVDINARRPGLTSRAFRKVREMKAVYDNLDQARSAPVILFECGVPERCGWPPIGMILWDQTEFCPFFYCFEIRFSVFGQKKFISSQI